MKLHYRTISSYRVLPSRWKIVRNDEDRRSLADRHLAAVDQQLVATREGLPQAASGDIASPLPSANFGCFAYSHPSNGPNATGLSTNSTC